MDLILTGMTARDAERTRVLLVDDSEASRRVTRQLLGAAQDIEVVGEVADGLSCLEAVSRLRPDVVLMDCEMAPMDGIETTNRLSALAPAVSTVALSVGSDPQALNRMREAGAVNVLVKGAGPEEIRRAVRAAALAVRRGGERRG